MAKVWATDTNNDTYLDSFGHIATYSSNIECVQQLARNVLQTFLGEVFIPGQKKMDTTTGIDWFNVMLRNDISIDQKNQELIDSLLTINLIKSVDAINYNQDAITGIISYTINITSVYGPLTVVQSVG